MSPDIELTIAGASLRPLKPEDVHEGYAAGLNDQEVNRYLDSVKRTRQTHADVVSFVQSNCDSADSVLWGIWRNGASRHSGTVRLHGIERFHRIAYIGVCLFDKQAWGTGLGGRSIRAVTDWAHSSLGMRWIEAGVYAENVASQKSFLSAGFEWVCEINGKYLFEGHPSDVKLYASKLPDN